MLRRHLSRRAFLSGAAAGVGTVALAEAPLTSLRPEARPGGWDLLGLPQADTILATSNLDGQVSFVVSDARTGEILETHAPGVVLPPASVAKAVTAVYALERLGATYQFETKVLATGPVEDGVVQGDLVLVGGGDPTLTSDHLADLAEQLVAAGITGARGGLKSWGGALPHVPSIDPGQPVQVGYSPSVGGLNLNFNRVHFEWKRSGDSYAITMEARTERRRPGVSSSSMAIVDSQQAVFAYENGGGVDRWTVARSALGREGARWLPVRNPARYAGDVFGTLLRGAGLSVGTGEVVDELPEGEVVASVSSEPLTDILRDMLKFSTNITAEAVGLAATQAEIEVSTLATSGAAMSGWARERFGIGASFVDHSGLGDQSRISAAAMVRALVGVGPDGPLRPILKDVRITDERGDLDPNPPITAVAKTGTLNFVSGLAGYATAADGRDLAFAIFAADVERRAGLSQQERENPSGARGYNTQAKRMQGRLLQRWGLAFPAA